MDSIAKFAGKRKVQIQGRRGLAEGALTPSPVPFLPNLLRPKYDSIIVQKCGAAKVKIFHLDTAPVYQITFAVSS